MYFCNIFFLQTIKGSQPSPSQRRKLALEADVLYASELQLW